MRMVAGVLPFTRWGDWAWSCLWFVRVQGRLPRRDSGLFNDYLFHLKTSNEIQRPLRALTSDKELVKLYVKAVVGDHYNVPTIAVLHSLQECRDFQFPARCVIKPTHLSGAVILRGAGEPIDFGLIERWLNSNYYEMGREANYRHLEPKVIVEPFVFEDKNPNDYKIFCYDGKPRLIQVDSDRHIDHRRDLYDVDWVRQPFSFVYPAALEALPRPPSLPLMLDLAAQLSAGFSFVRVDFYAHGEQALVGEITHCPENARGYFVPASAERTASRIIFCN